MQEDLKKWPGSLSPACHHPHFEEAAGEARSVRSNCGLVKGDHGLFLGQKGKELPDFPVIKFPANFFLGRLPD